MPENNIAVLYCAIEIFYLKLLKGTQFRSVVCLDIHTQRWWVVEVKEEFMCFLHPLTAEFQFRLELVYVGVP